MSVNVNDPKSVIVIGGGVAGMNVIGKLLGRKPSFDITCITKEPRYDYSTCGLPFVLEGKIEKFEDIILHKPEFFSENNVRVMNNTEVTKLDLSNQTIEIHDQEGTQDLHYDYLVLATGRAPVKPPIQGLELAGVHSLLNLEDGEKLSNEITGCKSAVIIGGGIIGLEMALGFIAKGIKSTVVELAPYVLPALLDEDMAKVVAEWLTEKGVTIITDNNVQSIDGTEHVEGVSLGNGQKLNADLVLLSTGIKPNIELALNTGLGIGKAKGFVTDTYQHVQLNGEFLNNVFACGDCVESKNLITNQPMVSALASTALLQASAIKAPIRLK